MNANTFLEIKDFILVIKMKCFFLNHQTRGNYTKDRVSVPHHGKGWQFTEKDISYNYTFAKYKNFSKINGHARRSGRHFYSDYMSTEYYVFQPCLKVRPRYNNSRFDRSP